MFDSGQCLKNQVQRRFAPELLENSRRCLPKTRAYPILPMQLRKSRSISLPDSRKGRWPPLPAGRAGRLRADLVCRHWFPIFQAVLIHGHFVMELRFPLGLRFHGAGTNHEEASDLRLGKRRWHDSIREGYHPISQVILAVVNSAYQSMDFDDYENSIRNSFCSRQNQDSPCLSKR